MWRGGAIARTSQCCGPVRPRRPRGAAETEHRIDARSSRCRRSAERDYIIRTLAGVHRRLVRPQWIELASKGKRMVTRAPVGLEVDSEFNRGRHRRSTSSNQYNGVAVCRDSNNNDHHSTRLVALVSRGALISGLFRLVGHRRQILRRRCHG